jgi:hypothetical protein
MFARWGRANLQFQKAKSCGSDRKNMVQILGPTGNWILFSCVHAPEFITRNERELLFFLFFFAVLGLELRVYTLSHSTSPFFVMGFSS